MFLGGVRLVLAGRFEVSGYFALGGRLVLCLIARWDGFMFSVVGVGIVWFGAGFLMLAIKVCV